MQPTKRFILKNLQPGYLNALTIILKKKKKQKQKQTNKQKKNYFGFIYIIIVQKQY